jgi:hypothetical protein
MGTYNLSVDEIIDSFENWLGDQEGEVHASVIAEAWNRLAEKHGWSDRLKAKEKPKPRYKVHYKPNHCGTVGFQSIYTNNPKEVTCRFCWLKNNDFKEEK